MYLRQRRIQRRRGISLRRLLFFIVVPLLIFAGIGLYENRETYIPQVQNVVNQIFDSGMETVATMQAPEPTPTADPSDTRQLADSAWISRRIQESVSLYESIIEALPNDIVVHYNYTLGLIMQGRYDDAVVAAENTVTANPFSSDTWAIRSLAYNRVSDYGTSIASALRALEIDPENARARAFLAESYADNGQGERALSEIQRALGDNPESYEAMYVDALLTWEVEFDPQTALTELSDAYDQSNGMIHVGINLARLQIALGDAEAGAALLQEMLDSNPNNIQVLFEIGRYYLNTGGDANQATNFFTRCITADPNNIDCHYNLGRAQQRQDEGSSTARISFEKAIELGSANPYHFWWAGTLQIDNLGDCAGAMRYFREGYDLTQTYLDTGNSGWSNQQLTQLISDYDAAMAPCTSFNPVPVTEEPEDAEESADDL